MILIKLKRMQMMLTNYLYIIQVDYRTFIDWLYLCAVLHFHVENRSIKVNVIAIRLLFSVALYVLVRTGFVIRPRSGPRTEMLVIY